jgi:hypothetical protein
MSERFYHRMFLVAALWNLVGGALILAFTRWIFESAHLSTPNPPLYYQSWIALFMVFGVGYYMVAGQPYQNQNLVKLGIIGKLAFAVIFIASMLRLPNQIPRLFLTPVIGDLVFVVLFTMFLSHARRSGK